MDDPIFKQVQNGPLVCDACSLIYLEKCDILELLAKEIRLLISSQIYEEICAKSEIASSDHIFVQLIACQYILIQKPPKTNIQALPAGIHTGEASVLDLWNSLAPTAILTDDGSLSRYCHSHKIPYLNSLMVVILLYKRKYLSYAQLLQKLSILESIGYYKPKILAYARSQI